MQDASADGSLVLRCPVAAGWAQVCSGQAITTWEQEERQRSWPAPASPMSPSSTCGCLQVYHMQHHCLCLRHTDVPGVAHVADGHLARCEHDVEALAQGLAARGAEPVALGDGLEGGGAEEGGACVTFRLRERLECGWAPLSWEPAGQPCSCSQYQRHRRPDSPQLLTSHSQAGWCSFPPAAPYPAYPAHHTPAAAASPLPPPAGRSRGAP